MSQTTSSSKQGNVWDQSPRVDPSDNSLWLNYLSLPMPATKARVFRKGHLWDESFEVHFSQATQTETAIACLEREIIKPSHTEQDFCGERSWSRTRVPREQSGTVGKGAVAMERCLCWACRKLRNIQVCWTPALWLQYQRAEETVKSADSLSPHWNHRGQADC